MNKSLLAYDIQQEIKTYDSKQNDLKKQLDIKKEQLTLTMTTPINIIKEYKEKKVLMETSTNSSKKKLRRELNDIEVKYKSFEKDIKNYELYEKAEYALTQNEILKNNTSQFIELSVNQLINDVLIPNHFINYITNHHNTIENTIENIIPADTTTNTYTTVITNKGIIASVIQEIHPLAFADVYVKTNGFDGLSTEELVSVLSCFTNINVPDDIKQLYPYSCCSHLKQIMLDFYNTLEYYDKEERRLFIDSGSNYDIHFDINNELLKWCNATTEEECKNIVQHVKLNKSISLGDFVKAILKINNIAGEIERVCEINNNIKLLEKVKKIPEITLKYVVSNQSLYI